MKNNIKNFIVFLTVWSIWILFVSAVGALMLGTTIWVAITRIEVQLFAIYFGWILAAMITFIE